jgi:hypothetical protein
MPTPFFGMHGEHRDKFPSIYNNYTGNSPVSTKVFLLLLFLNAFKKFRKATMTFIMSVCPSVLLSS